MSFGLRFTIFFMVNCLNVFCSDVEKSKNGINFVPTNNFIGRVTNCTSYPVYLYDMEKSKESIIEPNFSKRVDSSFSSDVWLNKSTSNEDIKFAAQFKIMVRYQASQKDFWLNLGYDLQNFHNHNHGTDILKMRIHELSCITKIGLCNFYRHENQILHEIDIKNYHDVRLDMKIKNSEDDLKIFFKNYEVSK